MNQRVYTILSLAILASVALSIAGCGPKTVHVSGKIVVDGQPAQNVRVVFQSASNDAIVPPVATGLTNAEGQYSLSLAEKKKKGAVPGPYVVFLTWSDPDAVENPVEGLTEEKAAPFRLPPRANSGELRYDVPDKGTKEANFEFDNSTEPQNVAPGV